MCDFFSAWEPLFLLVVVSSELTLNLAQTSSRVGLIPYSIAMSDFPGCLLLELCMKSWACAGGPQYVQLRQKSIQELVLKGVILL